MTIKLISKTLFLSMSSFFIFTEFVKANDCATEVVAFKPLSLRYFGVEVRGNYADIVLPRIGRHLRVLEAPEDTRSFRNVTFSWRGGKFRWVTSGSHSADRDISPLGIADNGLLYAAVYEDPMFRSATLLINDLVDKQKDPTWESLGGAVNYAPGFSGEGFKAVFNLKRDGFVAVGFSHDSRHAIVLYRDSVTVFDIAKLEMNDRGKTGAPTTFDVPRSIEGRVRFASFYQSRDSSEATTTAVAAEGGNVAILKPSSRFLGVSYGVPEPKLFNLGEKVLNMDFTATGELYILLVRRLVKIDREGNLSDVLLFPSPARTGALDTVGNRLAVILQDGFVQSYQLQNPKPKKLGRFGFEENAAYQITPDGEVIASLTKTGFKVWILDSGVTKKGGKNYSSGLMTWDQIPLDYDSYVNALGLSGDSYKLDWALYILKLDRIALDELEEDESEGEVLKHARNELLRKFHPDTAEASGKSTDEMNKVSQMINSAWEILKQRLLTR